MDLSFIVTKVKQEAAEMIKKLIVVLFIAVVLNSCLQSAYDDTTLDYEPQTTPEDISSPEFSASGSDMLIVTLYSGSFKKQSDLRPTQFVLQSGTTTVSLTSVPQRDSDTQLTIPVTALASGNYTLQVKAEALVDRARKVSVLPVTSGIWSAGDAASFGRSGINSITYGNGKFAAVCSGGEVASSSDGVTWSVIQAGSAGTQSKFFAPVNGIAYGNNGFIAAGDNAAMGYSEFGVSWEAWEEKLFGKQQFRFVSYGGNAFIAGGENGRIIYLRDFGEWTAAANSDFGSQTVIDAAFGNGVYVAVGTGGQLTTSTNLSVWAYHGSPFTAGNQSINSIAFGNGVFVAVGDGGIIAISSDGYSWSLSASSPFSNGILDVAYGGGVFLTVGHNGRMAKSEDGQTWEIVVQSAYSELDKIMTVAYGGGKFVTAGIGYDPLSRPLRIAYSYQKPAEILPPVEITDAVSSVFDSAIGDNKLTITLASGAFKSGVFGTHLAISGGTAGYADAKAAFVKASVERISDTQIIVKNLVPVVSTGSGQTVTISKDAIAEQPLSALDITVQSANIPVFDATTIWTLAYGGGTYVAGGDDGKIAYSGDGVIWTLVSDSKFGSNAVRGIAYGGGKFAAVGYNDTVAYSSDGATWTAGTVTGDGLPNNLYCVTWAAAPENKFVAAGAYGQIALSSDGENWTRQYADWSVSGNKDLLGIAYGDGVYVAVGGEGRVIYSDDGGTGWGKITEDLFYISETALKKLPVNSVTFGNGKFIAVGDGGSIKAAVAANIKTFEDKWFAWGDGIGGTGHTAAIPSEFAGSGILSITYGDGTFAAAGHNGKVSTSANGETWTPVTVGEGTAQTGFTGEEKIGAVVLGGSSRVTAGNAYSGNASRIVKR
ncbi:MAG: hypothetical protein LBN21_07955 [Treponema sp.]|jgi:hypothetical protein|nr:hypothetical protein [Treponema sp.]